MYLVPYECSAFEDSKIGIISAKKANIETFVSQLYYKIGDAF